MSSSTGCLFTLVKTSSFGLDKLDAVGIELQDRSASLTVGFPSFHIPQTNQTDSDTFMQILFRRFCVFVNAFNILPSQPCLFFERILIFL
jgi:hypothetical protein